MCNDEVELLAWFLEVKRHRGEDGCVGEAVGAVFPEGKGRRGWGGGDWVGVDMLRKRLVEEGVKEQDLARGGEMFETG